MATATKIYKKLTSDFTVVANEILRHNLSLKALGLYLYIISKPDGWEFSVAGTEVQVNDGDSSIRTAIAELEKAGFLFRERVRGKNGKLGGSNWIITDKPIQKPIVDFPHVEKPHVDKPHVEKTAQVNTIEVNTNKVNTNNITMSNHEGNQLDLLSQGKEELTMESIADRIVTKFNEVYGTRYRKISKNYMGNVEFWLDEYSIEDIEQAIVNSQYDEYWSKIFKKGGKALDLLFRKEKAKSGGGSTEKVDRIGDFLAMSIEEAVEVKPLTPMDAWEVANDKRVSWGVAKNKAKQINELIKNGEFQKKSNGQSARQILEKWINIGLDKRQIQHINEIEELELADMHPEKVKQRMILDRKKRKLIDEGLL